MLRIKARVSFFLLITGLISYTSSAQTFEFGGFVGNSFYQGDLSKGIVDFREAQYAAGAFGRFNMNPFFAIRTGVTYGQISGDDRNATDPDRIKRNLNFKSPILEVSIIGEYNILGYSSGSHRRYPGLVTTPFSPYIAAGLAIFNFNPSTVYQGTSYDLQPLLTERNKAYQLTQIAIPIGMGFKYNMSTYWTLSFEVLYRKTFTDYLDDVSGFYSDFSLTESLQGAEAAALSDRSRELSPENNYQKDPNVTRGNPDNLDAYVFSGFTISKRLK